MARLCNARWTSIAPRCPGAASHPLPKPQPKIQTACLKAKTPISIRSPNPLLGVRFLGLALPALRVTEDLEIPSAEITVRTSRSSGPGGQHANVTASRVEASFDVLASTTLDESQRKRLLARVGPRVVAVAQDERSQARNRDLALARLTERLARGLATPKRRRPTRPTAASRERRLGAKRQAAERKRDRRPPEE